MTEDESIQSFNKFTWEDEMELTLTQFYRWTSEYFKDCHTLTTRQNNL